MKIKEEQKKRQQMTKKQKKILTALSGFVILMGIALGIYIAKEYEENKVSAHPTSVITLDPGGTNEFKVPVDGTGLIETALVSASPTYDDYVQGSEIKEYFQKSVLNTFYENGTLPFMMGENLAYQFDNGNWLVIVAYRITSPTTLTKPVVYYVDKDGNVIDEYMGTIATGTLTNRFESVIGRGSTTNSCVITGKEGGNTTYFYEVTIVSNQLAITKIGQAPSAADGNLYTDGYEDVGSSKLIMTVGKSSYSLPSSGYFESPRFEYSIGTLTQISSLYLPDRSAGVWGTGELLMWYATNVQQGTNGRVTAATTQGPASGTNLNVGIEVFDASTGYSIAYYPVTAGLTMKKISEAENGNKLYYLVYGGIQTSKIIEVDVAPAVPVFTIVKEFSAGSNFLFTKNGSNFTFFGYVGAISGDFASFPLLTSGSVVTGVMDSSFSVISVKSAGSYASSLNFNTVISLGNDASGNLLYGVYGSTAENLDVAYPSGATSNSNTKQFFGVYRSADDYSPIIDDNGNITVDVSDPDINTSSILDNWLITGEKAGTFSSTNAIQVYDYTDVTINGLTISWLQSRINKNPNNLSAAIDWQKLGFDKTNSGPQLVTYFVTDSLLQPATTSRWINATTIQTVIKNDYALDAQNFAIPLTDISTDITNVNDFKELAKTMAWDMDSHVIDENGAGGQFDSSVTVDATQLAALQAATEAKPYPVDVTYDPKGDGSLLLTNRVWVFVTTKNTEVDTTNGIVIYADDYTLPLHLAQTETMADVYTHADVKVYDYYDTNHETTTPLSTLADKTTTTGLTVTNLSVITGATGATVVKPNIQYTSGTGITATAPDVTITAQVLMHVRQVVFSSTTGDLAELVMPSEGYLQLVNTSTRQLNLVVDSGEESTNPAFKEVYTELDDTGGNDKLDFDVIVPEYYEYKGYVVTNTAGGHSSTVLTAGTYQYDLTSGNYEQWITVYVTPKLGTDGSPKPYAWDYKLNDFGTIDAD